jgi:hypothetical protein
MRIAAGKAIAWLVVVALLVLFVALIPRGYSSDLSRIGKNQPAAVLTHDPGFLASAQLMEGINGLRKDFEPAVLFLVADLNTPQGRKFAEEQSVSFGALVLFDSQGRRLASYSSRADEAGLRAFLAQHVTNPRQQ